MIAAGSKAAMLAKSAGGAGGIIAKGLGALGLAGEHFLHPTLTVQTP